MTGSLAMASIISTALAFLQWVRVDQWEMLGILGKESRQCETE